MNYYIYYKVAPEQLPALRISVKQLIGKIHKQFGVSGRWLRRRDDPTTYMEVYEGVKNDAAFHAVLEREGAKLGVPRKLEVFKDALPGKPS